MSAFEARYPGQCEECGDRFPEDTVIRKVSTGVVHDICPDDALPPVHEVCPRCFIERSTAGTCGCDQ